MRTLLAKFFSTLVLFSVAPALFGQTVNLTLVKTGDSQRNAGSFLSYHLALTNSDATNAADFVSIDDPLPAGTTFISVDTDPAQPTWSCTAPTVGTNGTVTCELPTLAASASTFVDIVVQIDSSVPGGTVLTNTASSGSESTESDPSDNDDSWDTTVLSPAELSVTLGAAPDPVGPNDDITYTINVGNEGPGNSADAQLTFTAPPSTLFQSFNAPAGWSCNPPLVGTTSTVITCTQVSFPPGGDVLTAVMRVAASESDGATLTATAAVTESNTDQDPDDNNASASVTVQDNANLSVDKTAPATVIAGNTFNYTIMVQNLGPDPAVSATLTDTLGANLTYVSITQPAGWSCGASLGVVTCTNPSFPVSTSTFTLTVQVDPAATGTVSNDVSVSSNSTDNVLPNNQDSVSSNVTTSADLVVTKTGPATIAPGSDIAYTIVLTNNGPSNAQTVSLTDTITLPFVSLSSPGGWSCSTPAVGTTGLISCSNSTLASSANASFGLTLHVPPATPPGSSVSNTAQATSAITDPDSSNNTSTATTTVASGATLSVTKTITAGQAIVGTSVTYSVVITNNGPNAQFDNPGNEMLDQLPVGLTLISASATSGSAVADVPNNRVTWNGSIPNGGTVTVTIVAQINNVNASNQATVNYDADGNGTNESTASSNSAAFSLSPATLSVTKTIAAGAPTAGTSVTYSVVITNNGPSTQLDNPGNEMDDQLPAGLTLISASATSGSAFADVPSNHVAWNGSIPNGGTVTVTIVAQLNDVNASNQATVHFDADGNGTNESSATSASVGFAVPVPSLTPAMLALLAAMLAFLAMKRT